MKFKKKIKEAKLVRLFALLVIISVAFLAGCEKKAESDILAKPKAEEEPLEELPETKMSEAEKAREIILSMEYPVSEASDFDLILINKTHNLSEDYRPEDLVRVDRFVQGVGNDDTHMLRSAAAEALNKMLDAALEDGIELRLRTGFRSFAYQSNLYNSYVEKNGREAADTYSARPGYSEHQTGLCCDLGGKSQGFALSYEFGNTEEGKWVKEHAAEFGYIIRYSDGITDEKGVRQPGAVTGYVYEPWHIRYVGIENAKEITEKDICLEEYLGILE